MIHLIVGNTGSGKTTYSNLLKEETKGLVFSIDTWNKLLFLPDKTDEDGLDWFLERIERVEKLMMSLILQLETSDTDSILDLGLSKREHREKFRQFAKENNMECKLHFLDIPSEIRRERIMKRNREKGASFEFEVTDENFEFMESWFEPPDVEEMLDSVWIND
ncbi:AAA family ATPase [Ulvibacter antarcticus]|uniref:Putative kinase n=1 Tax=Ulvibacter antarcticus TaxID=442714 RepID=A0A3L9YWP8_9FLAO|nr:ATP-binding protein [Ulvibacter antarcticus]RMA58892.1 putative kinase [Ulvibacter antarcticus]